MQRRSLFSSQNCSHNYWRQLKASVQMKIPAHWMLYTHSERMRNDCCLQHLCSKRTGQRTEDEIGAQRASSWKILYSLGAESTKVLKNAHSFFEDIVQYDRFKLSTCLSVFVDQSQVAWQLTGLSPDVSSVVVVRMGKGIITAPWPYWCEP